MQQHESDQNDWGMPLNPPLLQCRSLQETLCQHGSVWCAKPSSLFPWF